MMMMMTDKRWWWWWAMGDQIPLKKHGRFSKSNPGENTKANTRKNPWQTANEFCEKSWEKFPEMSLMELQKETRSSSYFARQWVVIQWRSTTNFNTNQAYNPWKCYSVAWLSFSILDCRCRNSCSCTLPRPRTTYGKHSEFLRCTVSSPSNSWPVYTERKKSH